MARRLARTAARLGIDEEGRSTLRRAFDLGMARRLARGLDDHHPDYLHPSRTALILMDDSGVAAVPVLAAALVVETRDLGLAVPRSELASLDEAAVEVAAAVPGPAVGEDRLLETLLAASHGGQLVALAERLDHARHLHLRDRSEWAPYHHTTCSTYAPMAPRVDPALAGRLSWWCGVFARRFLDR